MGNGLEVKAVVLEQEALDAGSGIVVVGGELRVDPGVGRDQRDEAAVETTGAGVELGVRRQ